MVMLAVLAPPAAPAMVKVPVLTPIAHWMFPRERLLPSRIVLALSVVEALPRLRLLTPAGALGPPPVIPCVSVPSATEIVPAVTLLVGARVTVALDACP